MSKKIEIYLFVDALGWKIVQEHHFLDDLLSYRRGIEMQFGYSSSAIPTILSGETPAVHGHLGLFRFAPESSPFKNLAKWSWLFAWKSFWNRGRVRHHLSKWIKKFYGFTGYFQLYQVPIAKLALLDYCEKSNLFVPHGMDPVPNLADVLQNSGIAHHISDWHLNDAENYRRAEEAIKNGAQFLFVYTASLDGLLHYQVGKFDVVENKLQEIRHQIISLYNCAKTHGEVHFTVISDHGMTPLRGTVSLMTELEKSPLQFGVDYGACYDSTMARFHCLTPQAKEKIRQILTKFADYGHLVSAAEQQKYGIARADHIFGDLIFLLNPGWQLVPSDMGNVPLPGMHGFAPEDVDSQAAILSNAPVPEHVKKVADYFAMMQASLQELSSQK